MLFTLLRGFLAKKKQKLGNKNARKKIQTAQK